MRYVAGVAFAVAAFILVFLCIPETGIIYTHDTLSYDYAASTFIESGTLKYFGYDTPVIQWPPFYILVLAGLKALGITVEEGVVWLNAGLFAYLLYVSAIYLFDNLKVKALSIPALILLTLSVPIIYVSGYGWSEMLFIFLSVLSMVLMLMYIKRRKNSWFLSCALVSSLCWLTRYIGITVIAALALVLFISEKPFYQRLKMTFTYCVFSCFPMSLWVLRNYLLSGTFTGGRQPGDYTLNDNIEYSLSVFNEWFSFAFPKITYISLIYLGFLMLLAIPLKRAKEENIDGYTPDLPANFLIVVFYSAVLLYSATSTAMDPINSRLWSPVYPFLVFAVIFLADLLIRNIKYKSTKAFFAAGFIVFAIIFAVNPAMWIQSEGFPRKYAMLGSKQALEIKNSPVLALTMETLEPSENTLVISNEASILTVHTGLKCYYPPKKEGIPLYMFSQYSERIKDYQNIYLVWSGPFDSESFMDVAQFGEIFNMEKMAQNNYCVIYRLR
mgnify:CR=1 FL=1